MDEPLRRGGRVPPEWRVTAETEDNPIAAVESADGQLFGIQFHPEVVHTPQGKVILENFLRISRVPRDWTPARTLERLIAEVRERTDGGKKRVLLAISDGVDSSTLALLLTHADIEHAAVFVDHGLLHSNEREEVEQALPPLGVNLVTVDAADRFISALAGVADSEEKRKIIGSKFVGVFREEARKRGPFHVLAQGILYPDVIESAGSEGSASIKSHHNVGGLPDDIGFDLREADALFISALKETDLYKQTWQALTVLTPVQSVGVVGDERRYAYTLALRAVTSVDGMTADWARLPHDFLDSVASRITRRIPEIGRVVYDVTSKPPATIEWK